MVLIFFKIYNTLFLFHVCDSHFLKVSSLYVILFQVVVYLFVDLASFFSIRSLLQMLVILATIHM